MSYIVCVLLSLTSLAKGPSNVQEPVWIEFEWLPDGIIFEGTERYIADQGEWFATAWNIKQQKTLKATKWWTVFPRKVRIDDRELEVEGIEDPDPTELPHLRVKLPSGDVYVLNAMTFRSRYGVEYAVKPLTIARKPNTVLIIVRPEFEALLTSQLKVDSRFCLIPRFGDRCLNGGSVFMGMYVVNYRPGIRVPTGLSCAFSFDDSCGVVERDRFREQDVYKSCRDLSVHVSCARDAQKSVGSVTVVYYSKVVPFALERVRLCSALGCTPTYVGCLVQIVPGATGNGRYEFRK